MATLPDEYRYAREIYGMCRIQPPGKHVSRADINAHFGASSDIRKGDKISKAIRHLLWCNHLQKKVNRESCQVYFWATRTDPTPGDKVIAEPDEKVIDYLAEPPPPAPPPAPPQKITPPPTVEPKREADTPLDKRVLQFLRGRNGVASLTVMLEHLKCPKDSLLDTIRFMWEEKVLFKDSRSQPGLIVWLEGCEEKAGLQLVDDGKVEVRPKEPEFDDEDEDEEFVEESPPEDEEFFMMKDMQDKNNRILLRPTGDTITLSLREIEFIRGLKKPFVTL